MKTKVESNVQEFEIQLDTGSLNTIITKNINQNIQPLSTNKTSNQVSGRQQEKSTLQGQIISICLKWQEQKGVTYYDFKSKGKHSVARAVMVCRTKF